MWGSDRRHAGRGLSRGISLRPARGPAGSGAVVLAVGLLACGAGDWVGTTIERETVDLLAGRPPAVVLVFVTPDCPISNRYVPEINRLSALFAEEGVPTWIVYAGTAFGVGEIERHVAEYSLAPRPLLDPGGVLVARTGAQVTPEAVVLGSGGEVVYRGRIDDRWVDFGKARPRPTSHDLEDAVEAVLAGRPVREPRTRAVGCYLAPAVAIR